MKARGGLNLGAPLPNAGRPLSDYTPAELERVGKIICGYATDFNDAAMLLMMLGVTQEMLGQEVPSDAGPDR